MSVYYEKVRVKVTCKIECNLPSFSVDRLLCDFWRYSLKGYTNAFMSIVPLKSNKLQVKLSKSLSSYHILKAIYMSGHMYMYVRTTSMTYNGLIVIKHTTFYYQFPIRKQKVALWEQTLMLAASHERMCACFYNYQ